MGQGSIGLDGKADIELGGDYSPPAPLKVVRGSELAARSKVGHNRIY